jgi:hypothetical protein
VILALDPGDPDWKFGDVLRLRRYDRRHEYLYMFMYRKPPFYMEDDTGSWKKGDRNDRPFVALELGVPDCPYPAGPDLYPCHFDHSGFNKVNSSLGGLPYEAAWELVDPA